MWKQGWGRDHTPALFTATLHEEQGVVPRPFQPWKRVKHSAYPGGRKVLNGALTDVPLTPALQSAHHLSESSSGSERPASIQMSRVWHRSWQQEPCMVFSVWVPWLLHKNAVGFKWRNSSESALKIAKFHGSARYHHTQRRTLFPRS